MARLLISSPDGKRGILEITKPVITVGRGHSNDLVLNEWLRRKPASHRQQIVDERERRLLDETRTVWASRSNFRVVAVNSVS